jgi:hypothetical protein
MLFFLLLSHTNDFGTDTLADSVPLPALLEAVRESNRNKVSALAEDNWMFEAEEQPRLA